MESLLQEALMDRFMETISPQEYQAAIEDVINRNLSPYEAVKALLNGGQE
jgi:hypothetical protein